MELKKKKASLRRRRRFTAEYKSTSAPWQFPFTFEDLVFLTLKGSAMLLILAGLMYVVQGIGVIGE